MAETADMTQLALPHTEPGTGAVPVEKTIWGSPAGKKRLAARLVKLIPPHRAYVEPFAGSAAVFFAKDPVDTEVLGDADPEIAFAFNAIKTLTPDEHATLRQKDWVGRERTFKALIDARPRSKVEKLYRFLYLSHFSYGKLRGKSFNPNADGVEARTLERIETFGRRLKNATIRHGHYAAIVKEFDGRDTFFYLDPPYPGHNVEIGENTFDEAEFRRVLDGIKGKFLVTYGTRGQLDTRGFQVRKIRPPRSIRAMRGVGGPKTLPQLLIANYAITEKALGPWGLDEVLDILDIDAAAGDALELVKAHVEKLAIAGIHPDRLRDAPDEEVLSVHRRLHQLFGGHFAGNDRLSAGDLRREDLVNAEILVQAEMVRRGMHHEADDELAREAASLQQTTKAELAPVHPSGETQGSEIGLAEVLPHFHSFKLRAPFLYLVGGLANNGRTANDIDVLMRGPVSPELRKVIEFRLGRMLPPELSRRLQLLEDETAAGPYTSHVELADLVVEVRPALEVKQMRLAAKQDDPLLDLPKKRGPRRAVLQYHFRGRSVHADLRLQVDDYLVGWTLALQRPGAVGAAVDTLEEAHRIARSFSVEGDRYAKPLLAPAKVFATPKARQPLVWLTIDGEVFGEGEVGATRNDKGVIVALDHPRVEWGLQKPFAHEYFFSGGKELAGVMHFRLLTGQAGEPQTEIEAGRRSPEGEPFWTAFLSRELLPSVLKPRAVETRSMPSDGCSAMPVSLERVTPKEYRFWEAKGDEAREMRDALVDAGFFTPDNVRLVDGEFRRVVQKLFLAAAAPDEVAKAKKVPFNQWGGSAKYAKKLAERLPEHGCYVEPFCGSAAVLFAKEPAEEEVLADADPDVVFALRYIKKLDQRAFAALERLNWKVSRAGFERARACEPRSDAERFWKLAYGRLCSWGGKSDLGGFSTIHAGQTYDLEDLWRFRDRLQGVRLVRRDWQRTLAEHDGPGTLFFIDPPYVEEWDLEDGVPPEDIAAAVAKLQGHYVIAYTDSARARRALAKVGRPFKLRFLEARHAGLWKKRSRLFVASYKLRKSDDVGWVDDDTIDVAKAPREVDFTLSWQYWKGLTVVRATPSKQVWHLVLDRTGTGLETWVLQADPLSGVERVAAIATPRKSKALLTLDGDVAPGQSIGGDILNDTKDTPSTVRIQDRGTAVLLDDQASFKKIRFEGERLHGVYTLTAEEASSDVWQLAPGGEPGRAIPAAKAAVPMKDGVQTWEKDRKDPDLDRTQLRPLAIFQPQKPAPRATNEFREVASALAWPSAEMLHAGIAVEPKFNGFRVVLEKAGDRVFIFTEDTKRDISNALPHVAADLRGIEGDVILDGEFLDFNEAGDPRPRRELAEFRADEPRDDARAKVQIFDVLFWQSRNLTAMPYEERRHALVEVFGQRFKHLHEVEATLVHDRAALERAIEKASKAPGSEGAMLKLASSTYSLGGENDAWAKLKLIREIRALVYERHPVKDAPGVYNFACAVGPVPREDAGRWKETVEVGGKLYTPIGKTFNAKLDATVGDVLRVEVTEILVDRAAEKHSVTWFTPVVIDRTDAAPMTPEQVARLAQPQEVKKLLEAALARRIPLLKTSEERYVLGVVLEPETVDAQKDIYSAAEVRDAAHRFMEEYQNVGLMHRDLVNGRVKILESYIAPVDFEIDGARVKKGTWLLAVRVLDDELWRQVKAGELRGFSIGGNAVRNPEPDVVPSGASKSLESCGVQADRSA